MALNTVLSVEVKPGEVVRYASHVERLADAARKKKEKFTWRAFSTLFGERTAFHFVSAVESFAELEARGTAPELVARVLGADDAARFVEETGARAVAQRLTIGLDRPDLSYVRGAIAPESVRASQVTRIRIRSGGREAFEELLRKIAEAIPKLDDPAQLITRQIIVGNAAEYVAIRPLRSLADLDQQRPPDQLLVQAFGPGEGGLVFRNGGEAIEHIEREIVGYREELSNPAV